jgi:spore germination protein KC
MRVIKSKAKSKIWVSISIILLLIVPLTGCWDSNEPDRMVYAQGLGVDYKNGRYTVYLQLINLSLLAKAESSGGSTEQIESEIGQSSGKSIEDAIFNLYKTSQRRIHWGHLTYILLTRNALKHSGLQDISDIVDRYFETHYRMWIYSTDDLISNIFNTDPPINMSTYLSRLSDPEAAFEQFSFIQTYDMREVIISHYEPPHEVIIPIVSSNKNDWKGDNKARNIGVIKGISIIGNTTLKGSITNKDVNGYRWIEKEFRKTGFSLAMNGKRTVGLTITKRKVKIVPIIKNGRVQFDIQIKTKAVINKLKENIPSSQISTKAKELIKKEVKKTFIKGIEIDSDVYQLSHVLYKKDFRIWKKIERRGKIPLGKDSIRNIDVTVKIIDGGKQRKVPTLEWEK